jgi:hypothetical protein
VAKWGPLPTKFHKIRVWEITNLEMLEEVIFMSKSDPLGVMLLILLFVGISWPNIN